MKANYSPHHITWYKFNPEENAFTCIEAAVFNCHTEAAISPRKGGFMAVLDKLTSEHPTVDNDTPNRYLVGFIPYLALCDMAGEALLRPILTIALPHQLPDLEGDLDGLCAAEVVLIMSARANENELFN